MAVCFKCHKAVKDNAVYALGNTYHANHFTCTDCKRPIDTGKFNMVKNQPVCSDCYKNKHTPRCFCCGTHILERAVSIGDRKWHEKCFRCATCCINLMDSNFFEINGYLFCKPDYLDSFSSRCAGCSKPIRRNALVALNTKWHARCFKCSRCTQTIRSDKFYIDYGRPVCTYCIR